MKRRWKIALVVVIALLLGFVAANEIATSVLERRLSARMTEAVGKPVRVDLHGWPAPVRLLFGGLPRADALSTGEPVSTSLVRTLAASLHDLDLAAASLVDERRPVSLTGSRLYLEAAFRPETAPLGMSRLEVMLVDLGGHVGRGATGTLLSASEARLMAENLSLPESPAGLASFQAWLSDARVTKRDGPGTDLVLVESPRTVFEAVLTEDAINRAWTYPGRVSLLPGVVSLTVGPVSVDVDVHVAGRHIVLDARVPRELRSLVGDAPQLSFTPALPLGAQMEAVEVRRADLVLRGSATRLEVPLPAAPPY